MNYSNKLTESTSITNLTFQPISIPPSGSPKDQDMNGLAALPDGLDRADRSEARMAASKAPGPKREQVLLLPNFTTDDLRRSLAGVERLFS
jgi:hypothetical protein